MTAWLHVKSLERNGREFWEILEKEDEKRTSGHSRFAHQPFQIHANAMELNECV